MARPFDLASADVAAGMDPDAAVRKYGITRPDRINALRNSAAQLRKGPQRPQGGQSQGQDLSRRKLLESLVLGSITSAERSAAFGQAMGGQTMAKHGFDQDALMALVGMQPEGAPPAPFETQFKGKQDLLQALIGGRVDPRMRTQATTALIGREPHPDILKILAGQR
jgi:hypothetical protein